MVLLSSSQPIDWGRGRCQRDAAAAKQVAIVNLRLSAPTCSFCWSQSTFVGQRWQRLAHDRTTARPDSSKTLALYKSLCSFTFLILGVIPGYQDFRRLPSKRKIGAAGSNVRTPHFAPWWIQLRMDYCNSLLFGISHRPLRRLPAVQNAAARLVTGTGWREHITPVFRQLHWLSMYTESGHFNKAPLIGQSPQYLTEDCHLTTTTGR